MKKNIFARWHEMRHVRDERERRRKKSGWPEKSTIVARSGLTEIICDDNTDADKIVSAIKNDGYDVKEVNVSDFEKHGLFLKF